MFLNQNAGSWIFILLLFFQLYRYILYTDLNVYFVVECTQRNLTTGGMINESNSITVTIRRTFLYVAS